MVNGDAYSRAHWVSYAVGTVFGAKGLGAVTKTGVSTTKAAVQKGAATAKDTIKKADITKYLPYSPQHQLATPEGIPYNVVNGVGLRDRLITKAQKISDLSRVPFTGRNVSLPWLGDKYKAVEIEGKVKAKGEVKEINRRVYTLNDIDLNQMTRKGETNLELMKKGNAPFAKDGTKINLHHLIQEEPGTMVEIPESLHQQYSKILHGLKENGESFRNDPVLKAQYDNFRDRYWKWRAKQFEIEKD